MSLFLYHRLICTLIVCDKIWNRKRTSVLGSDDAREKNETPVDLECWSEAIIEPTPRQTILILKDAMRRSDVITTRASKLTYQPTFDK